MKIKITEEQHKLLKENDIEVYHDQSDQYASGSENKFFYTEIDPSDIDWESSKYSYNGYENAYYKNPSKIVVDWGCKMNYSESGFSYQPFINSVKGIFVLTPDNGDAIQFPIDTKKDWKFSVYQYYFDGDNNIIQIKSITVHIDKKLIEFR